MDHQRRERDGKRRLSAALFVAFFSAQAAFVVLAPTLPDVAREFGISVASAGELRTAAAISGVVVAVALTPLAGAVGVRRLLIGGLAALSAGAAICAAAPELAVLALGQIVVGAGVACVLSAGLAAATEWPAPEQRPDVLAWATVGQPAAWVVGMPVVGVLSELGWRWGWVIVPAAALPAMLALPRQGAPTPGASGRPRRAWRDPGVRRWAAGELLAYAGWGGTLVFAGALLAESYDVGANTVGLLLGAAALAYFPGTFAARKRLDHDLGPMLATLALGLAAGSIVFGLVRPAPWVSTATFAALVLLAGARGIAGSAFGVNAAPADKVAIGGIRSAALQLGYLLGAAGGGMALEIGGYPALGLTLGTFFAAAAVPHLIPGIAAARRRRSIRALAFSAADPCGGA